MKVELLRLAERCEQAEGADRELDKAIYASTGGCNHERTERYAYQDDTGYTCLDCGTDTYGAKRAPLYTASFDAALALIPEGYSINVGNDVRCWANVWFDVPAYDGNPYEGRAASLSLALCAASLRARASMENTDGN